MIQNISLGFSPCPNDTFIFDALVNNKIKHDINFEMHLEDVQTLNEWALKEKLLVSKVSYGVWPLIKKKYTLLQSGGALGWGVGPILIGNKLYTNEEINNTTIALPGENTTAHFLFKWAFPYAKNKIFLRYDEIENFVIENKGLGVIIHENRFTYEQIGLTKINDLGELWHQKLNMPIPLGGIVAHNSLGTENIEKLDLLIKKSVEFAFENNKITLTDFIKNNAQEMSEDVMQKHIDLYVNEFTLNLGDIGNEAIFTLLQNF